MWTAIKAYFAKFSVPAAILGLTVTVLLLVAKFKDLLIGLLVGSSKKLLADTQAQDGKLAAEESAANNQANTLVDEAKKLGEEKPTVTDEWYKK